MKHKKRIISLFLAITLLFSTLHFSDVSALAQLREAAYTLLADISNAANGISLTAAQDSCNHNYEFYSIKNGNPTCTNNGNVIFKCTLCGATETRRTALGHYYVYTSDEYGEFYYSCSYCNATTTAFVDDLYANFDNNINKKPQRDNDNCLLDVVADGIINAKDYSKLRQGERKITPTTLTNQRSNETTKKVYRYLCDMYGKKTLSAQQESTWMGSVDYEMNYIYNNTGKYPAMRGLDYMNDDFNGVNSRAINWWNRGGLVTICWHTGSDFTGEWNDAMNDTVPDWSRMLTEGTSEYNQMIAGMDKAANALLQLKNNGVTVLWRPFHEFDGAWFWWGKGGSENFKTLWKIMYDRYTNYWGLNNLIWVLGYSHNGSYINQWNPGKDYYDIIGFDTYSTSEFVKLYNIVKPIVPKGKPFVLHECGTNPTDTFLKNYTFGYFMTWHTTYLTDDNTTSALNMLYNSDRVITLDELDYSSY